MKEFIIQISIHVCISNISLFLAITQDLYGGKHNHHSFHYIIKSSRLKLLCTLAHLCEGTPLQQLRLDFFGIDIPLASSLTISISHFLRAGKQNKGKGTDPISTLRSPAFLLPQHREPPPPTYIPPS